jgi:hypothetical protein
MAKPRKPPVKPMGDADLFGELPCAGCGGTFVEHGSKFGGPCPERDCFGYTDDGEHGED